MDSNNSQKPENYQRDDSESAEENSKPEERYVSPEIQQLFNIVDTDQSGKINAKELQAALRNSDGNNFSDAACNLLISMFDDNNTKTVDVYQFQKLYTYINQWLATFRAYDKDQSGYIEEDELKQVLTQMGFCFSSEFIKLLIFKCDPQSNRQMSIDQFIVTLVLIQRFTEAFGARDMEKRGIISLAFEDFIDIVLNKHNVCLDHNLENCISRIPI